MNLIKKSIKHGNWNKLKKKSSLEKQEKKS